MSHAAAAARTLKDAAKAEFTATFEAGSRFARAHAELRKQNDVVEVMRDMVPLIVAIEELHAAADAACKALRRVLAQTMNETGATSVQSEHHGAHLAKRPAFVDIPDEAAVPDEYVETRRAIDKRKIAAALKDGARFNWASLVQPTEQILVLRARKQ